MRTELRIRRKKNGQWKIVKEGGKIVYAEWKEVTVRLWHEITEYNCHPQEVMLQRNLWRWALEETNLVPGLEWKREKLTDKSLQKILSYIPGEVPARLIHGLLKSIYLSKQEQAKIEYDCQTLWMGDGSRLKEPSFYTDLASSAMAFKERFGVPLYDSMEDLPLKIYTALKLTAQSYNQVQSMNQKGVELQREAARKSGVRR